MAQDVLLVDDDRIALENFGNEVRLNLGIEPFLADNPLDALNILRYYPIKVLVTDQLMPNINGTVLVRQVREVLKLTLPCILLTGYTEEVDSFDLVNLQFFKFIDKLNTHTQLTQSIRQAIQRYDMEQANKYSISIDKTLACQKGLFFFGPRVTLKLLRISSIVDPYIREQEWNTELLAQRNISSTQEISIHRRVSSSYEYGGDMDVLNQTGLKIGKLIGELDLALQHKFSLSERIKNEREVIIEAKQTIEVKEISDTLTQEGLCLQSREYQSAPVYIRVNCVLEVICNCCQIPRYFNISLDIPDNRIALRQVEHFDKGPEKKIYTGFIKSTLY